MVAAPGTIQNSSPSIVLNLIHGLFGVMSGMYLKKVNMYSYLEQKTLKAAFSLLKWNVIERDMATIQYIQ
jgi:hypothetical protein